MGILPILTVLMIFINLLFSGMIYAHGNKKWTEIFYALTSFFASIWSLAVLLVGLEHSSLAVLNMGVLLHYVAGDLAYICILWFAVFNQHKERRNITVPLFFSVINFGIIFWMIIYSNKFFHANPAALLQDRIIFQFPGYAIFVLSLTIIFFLMIAALFREYGNTDPLTKLPIKYIIFATFFGGGSGILLNLYFPWGGDFRFFVINPIVVTLLFTGISFYTLLKYELFNIKVIGTELLTFIVWASLLVQIFLAETQTTQILSSILFCLTVIFGILQIQSVIKEIRTRERIEKLSLELQKTNAELERASQAKSDFLSIASHQLKTPLSIIKGYLSMATEGSFGKLGKDLHSAIDKVYISNERLISLVEDLLNLSRIEDGRMKYEFTTEDLCVIVSSVVDELKQPAEKRGLKLVFHQPKHSLLVEADEIKLRNVVFNLIDNAVKYTEKGRVTVSVSKNGSSAHLDVTDTGIGIPPDKISKLFGKFERLDEGHRNYSMGGFGLGLYVTKLIVTAHNGTIWAESPGLEKGSTFKMELPLIKDVPAVAKPTSVANEF